MYSETHGNATQSHPGPSAQNRPSADSLRRFFGFRFVAVTFAVGICCQPHVSFVSHHRPGAVHRVDLQPVVAPGRPSLVSFAQIAPAAGALGRHAALFRFKPDRNGLPATPVPKLTLWVVAMIKVGVFEAKTHLSALLEKVGQGQEVLITATGRRRAGLGLYRVGGPIRKPLYRA